MPLHNNFNTDRAIWAGNVILLSSSTRQYLGLHCILKRTGLYLNLPIDEQCGLDDRAWFGQSSPAVLKI